MPSPIPCESGFFHGRIFAGSGSEKPGLLRLFGSEENGLLRCENGLESSVEVGLMTDSGSGFGLAKPVSRGELKKEDEMGRLCCFSIVGEGRVVNSAIVKDLH